MKTPTKSKKPKKILGKLSTLLRKGSMGLKASKSRKRKDSYPGVCLKDFKFERNFISNIGRGGFGRVLAMTHESTNRHFAIKSLSKSKIIAKDQVENSMNEFTILKTLDHSLFVVNLWYAFQDKHHLYMSLDLMLGGSIEHNLGKTEHGYFNEERARFYMAELTLGLQFLHANHVIHRDIKPDNLLIDEEGHLRITDFNVSLFLTEDDATITHGDGWGTRGYRAPEVYLREGCGFMYACDWWSAGATLYRMLTGRLPYRRDSGESPSDYMRKILRNEFDRSWGANGTLPSKEAKLLCEGLLMFKPEERLGCQDGPNSEVAILTQSFFAGINWDGIESRDGTVKVPWIPKSTMRRNGSNASSKDRSSSKNCQSGSNIAGFADNFDSSLDHRERMRVLQRNMGVLGFDGFDEYAESSDDEEYRQLSPAEQAQFIDWKYNVDLKLDVQKRPAFAMLQVVSSMEPNELQQYILSASSENLRMISNEMKKYHESELNENFHRMQTELRIDELGQSNVALSRTIRSLQIENALLRDSLRQNNVPLPEGLKATGDTDDTVSQNNDLAVVTKDSNATNLKTATPTLQEKPHAEQLKNNTVPQASKENVINLPSQHSVDTLSMEVSEVMDVDEILDIDNLILSTDKQAE